MQEHLTAHGESGKPRIIAQILHADAAAARKKASGNRFHLDYWKQCVVKVGESYSLSPAEFEKNLSSQE